MELALGRDAEPDVAVSLPLGAGRRLLLDGVHLVQEAHDIGIRFEAVAIAATHAGDGSEAAALARALERDRVEISSVSEPVMAAMSPVRTPSMSTVLLDRKGNALWPISVLPSAAALPTTFGRSATMWIPVK